MSNGAIHPFAATYTRPIKIGGNQNYVDEVAMGYTKLPSKELDDDLNTLYQGLNDLRDIALTPIGQIPDRSLPGIKLILQTVTDLEIKDLCITSAKLANLGVTTGKIADGAVTDAKITSVSWAKIMNPPAGMAPSGAAGGSLQGTYPNPQIAPNVVSRTNLTTDVNNSIPTAPTVADANKVVAVAADGSHVILVAAPPATLTPGQVTTPYLGLAPSGVDTANINNLAVTDAKIAGMAYSKLTGAPTSLPPSGPAGGALTGTYPNPGVNYSGITGVPSALPPTGPASGDLVGTYPGPTIRPNFTAPPSGVAGGSLAGTYPNPTLSLTGVAAGSYGSATAIPVIGLSTEGRLTSISTVAVSIPPGTTVGASPPASPAQGQMWWRSDPDGNLYIYYNDGTSSQWVPAMASVGSISGPAGGDLQGNYPNPTIIPSHLPWSISGATLTPTDATKRVTIPGTTATGVDQTQLQLGTDTAKGRLTALPGTSNLFLTDNVFYNGSVWAQDDTSKPSWITNLGAALDAFRLLRIPAGSTIPTTLLTLDNAGQLTSARTTGDGDNFICQSAGRTLKGHVGITPSPSVGVRLNANLAGTASDDTTLPSWTMQLDSPGDAFSVWRAPATTGAPSFANQLTLSSAGNLTIAGPTGTKSTGTTWANPSDRRIKDEIADYPTGLAAILALQPRTFLYNGKGGSQAGLRGYGYVADEAGAVIPEMLSTTRAKLNIDDEEDSDIETLDTSNVTLVLVNAVKELADRVAALEAK